jgi:transposase-like protein
MGNGEPIFGEPLKRQKCRKKCASVAASLEEAGDDLLTFWHFPQTLHESIRTTNIIERINQEFRRRVKTQGPLPSEGAVLRLFFGLLISGNLKMRKVRGFKELNSQARSPKMSYSDCSGESPSCFSTAFGTETWCD